MCTQDGRIAQADRQSFEADSGLNHHPGSRTTEQPFRHSSMKLIFVGFFGLLSGRSRIRRQRNGRRFSHSLSRAAEQGTVFGLSAVGGSVSNSAGKFEFLSRSQQL